MTFPDHELDLFQALKAVGEKPADTRPGQVRLQDSTEIVEDVQKEEAVHEKALPSTPSSVTLHNVFSHPDTHPLILDLLLLRRYGPDWLDWEPETVKAAILHDFSTNNVSDLNLAKLNACKALHLVDSFWQRWEVFTWLTMALNGVFPDFNIMQVPTVGQMLVAVDIANKIRVDTAWSDEMQAVMKTVYMHDGILVPVPPVDFFTIDTDAVDVDDIDKKWPGVRSSHHAPSADTITDEQLRRMLAVTKYLEESRTRLNKQMELIPNA
jgi:hypothetical protein